MSFQKIFQSQSCKAAAQEIAGEISWRVTESTYPDVVPDEAGQHEPRWAAEGEPHEPPEILRPLRQQQAGGLGDVLDGEEPRGQVRLLEAHFRRNEHEALHRRRERVGEVVRDEPAVANADDGVPLRRGGEHRHSGGDAGGLVGRGAVGGGGRGGAEEDEVRDVGGQAGGEERAEEWGPLPGGSCAESVQEEDRVQGFGPSGGGGREP